MEMRFKNLSIEGDSNLIVEFVQGRPLLGWAIHSIMGDIWKFLMALDHYKLHHFYREYNAVVDAMEGLGFDLGSLKSWMSTKMLWNYINSLIFREMTPLNYD